MSKLLEDLEKLASAEFVDLSVADAARDTIIRQQEEIEKLRAMLPPTAHSGVRNGPGEGSWSVFAEKVVEERDAARAEAEKLRAEIEALHAALKRRDAERLIERMSPSEKMAILDRLEAQERRRRAELEGKA